MSDTVQGPAEAVLTAAVARRYYVDGKAKTEIAEEFGVSRFKVARLLSIARDTGLVRIEIGRPGVIDLDLSVAVQERHHLQHVLVVDSLEKDRAVLRDQVGRAGADLLSEIVFADDVVGLGWGRSLLSMRKHLTKLAHCPVVQLTGAMTRSDIEESPIDLVRDVARVARGPSYYFYAPMVVPDATTAAVLLRQPDVHRAFERFSSVTKAVVAVGAWNPPASMLYDALSPAERKELLSMGACADVSGVLLDGQGRPVDAAPVHRMVRISAEELGRIPEVIGLAYGAEKAAATRAAIAGGYITSLVTHTSLAQALLARP